MGDFLKISGQAADNKGGFTVLPYLQCLNRSLETCMTGSYSRDLSRIGLIVRVDRPSQSWGPSGVADVQRPEASKALIETVMPAGDWDGQDHTVIRENVLRLVQNALSEFTTEQKNLDTTFDVEKFNRDWQMARENFLVLTRDKPTLALRSPSGQPFKLP